MKITRINALVKKEGIQVLRDPSTFLISFFLPFFLLFLYGYGLSLDLDHLRIGLVLEDTSPEAMTLARSFMDSTYFDVTIARDRRELTEKIVDGSIRGMVIIPSYFSKFQYPPVQVIADGSETNTSNFVLTYAEGALSNYLARKGETPEIRLESRVWYNEELESRYFILSGALAIVMTTVGALLTALVVAKEWERGTMEALISTQVTRGEIVMSKTIPYLFLGMCSMTICVLLSVFLFGLPLRGSWWLLALVSSAFLLTMVGLGLMISTLARNQLLAYQITMITAFLPAYILSGFLFEISSMPWIVRKITYFLPATYFVQSLQTLYLVGNVWKINLFNCFAILVSAVIFFTITVARTAKTLD